MKALLNLLLTLFFLEITSYKTIAQDQKTIKDYSSRNRLETTNVIKIDINNKGRIYEGMGAVSGGGSNSRLLIDYSEPYRSEILDYLFKPKFGANLQNLKVEIGADACIVGSEPSHARSLDELKNPKEEYFKRGFEFWMMNEAKQRNPSILLGALEWTVPFYTGGHWTQTNADYLVGYIAGIKKYYGFELDYISPGRNESHINYNWLKDVFKPTLDQAGFSHIKILAPDDDSDFWEIGEVMRNDNELAEIVDYVGYHYVHGHLPKLDYEERAAPNSIKEANVSLWASEDWSTEDNKWSDAHLLAGQVNKAYIRDKITCLLIWNIIDAIYNNVQWGQTGLLRCDQPWSGYYEVSPTVWAIAHTTQFIEPGWRYLDGACGFFETSSGGSYVTAIDSLNNNISVVIYNDSISRSLQIDMPKKFSEKSWHVWKSTEEAHFIYTGLILSEEGVISLQIEPNSIYTITTTTGQAKGKAKSVIPASKNFPMPYETNFNNEKSGKSGKYFADMDGCFEIINIAPDNNVLRQVITTPPYDWVYYMGYKPTNPITVIGNPERKNYKASVDIMFENKGYGELHVMLTSVPKFTKSHALRLYSNGSYELIRDGVTIFKRRSINGDDNCKGTFLKKGQWVNLSLEIIDGNLTAWIDGNIIINTKIDVQTHGMIGLGSSWDNVCFDNVKITE